MKKVMSIMLAISILLIFVVDLLFYQQPIGRMFIVILSIVGLISGIIISKE